MNEEYIRPEDARRMLKITDRTLFEWSKKGKLKYITTKGGHRRYLKKEIYGLCGIESEPKLSYCYCRVNSKKYKKELDDQITLLQTKYPEHILITDYGSGMNLQRKGLKKILDEIIREKVEEVVITSKDRLCRIGFEFFENLIQEYSSGKITIYEGEDEENEENEEKDDEEDEENEEKDDEEDEEDEENKNEEDAEDDVETDEIQNKQNKQNKQKLSKLEIIDDLLSIISTFSKELPTLKNQTLRKQIKEIKEIK